LNFTKSILDPILDFVYPPICLACGLDLYKGEHLVCAACWQSVEMVYSGDETYKGFIEKFSAEGVVSRVISPFYFEKDGKLQSIIHALKYQGYTSLGTRAGSLLGRLIKAEDELAKADYTVPVPLHSLKRRERGYNQSEFICRGIEEETRIPARTDLLHRSKYTISQTQLSLEERKENVGDAFTINEESHSEVSGKRVILVDDVITTGSTINSCARELRNAGAKEIYAAAIALAK
jgi:ComF family protein